MQLDDRINALWRLFLADSADGRRLRRRAAATAAMACFILVLLVALNLAEIVLLVLVTAAAGGALVAFWTLARRYRSHIMRMFRFATAHARAGAASVAAVATRVPSWTVAATSRTVARTRKSLESRLPRARNGWSRARAATSRRLAATATDAQRRAVLATSRVTGPSTPQPIDLQREALSVNAAGTRLRREGSYAEAAEQHRVALKLFRDLGDRRSEALTLNNLALALDRTGDLAALQLFEEAATILGELGDEQHEGQVIANLAMAFRRRGHQEESAEVLELALEKLSPESSAYRQVEELRRAS
jgi:tetratricopeptide (TPR) repeat protein